jgi:hypothetical protein
MATSTFLVRRVPALVLVLSVLSPALASDPSPRRQRELESVVAKRRAERERKTRIAAQARADAVQARAETVRMVADQRAYEIAMGQSYAQQQMAIAWNNSQLAAQLLSMTQRADCGVPDKPSRPLIVLTNPRVPTNGRGDSPWQPYLAAASSGPIPTPQPPWPGAASSPRSPNPWSPTPTTHQSSFQMSTSMPIAVSRITSPSSQSSSHQFTGNHPLVSQRR